MTKTAPSATEPDVSLAKREAEIAASGLSRLDYMLKVLRDPKSSDEDKCWAAVHAAPYCHPRLDSVDIAGELTLSQEDALNELDG